MLDEGFMTQTRAKTIQQEREKVYAALQYAANFHCLVEEWKDCAELKPQPKKKRWPRHRTEWCAVGSKYQCMRCGRDSKYMKMQGKCTGPNCQTIWEDGESDIWEDMTWREEWTGRERF